MAATRGTGRLLERDRELALIAGALRAAREGSGGLLAIEAGPGMGKSSLLAAAATTAAGLGVTVLRAQGGDHERALAFGGVLQAYEPALQRAPRGERARLLSGSAALAAGLFDAPGATRRLPDEAEALSIAHGLLWLTTNLCHADSPDGAGGVRPIALLVDDAHLLDHASVNVLFYLSRRLEELPVALVVAFRAADAGSAPALASLRAGAASIARPGHLSAWAVQELIDDQMGAEQVAPEFAEACLRVTGGNPFLVRELLVELRDGRIGADREAAAQVDRLAPQSVLHAVVARLARLGPAAAGVARAVVVLGQGATLQLVAAMAGTDLEDAAATADALAGAGVFAPGEPPRFSHALIGSAVESGIPAGARAAAELQAARLLAERGESDEHVAVHLLRAVSGSDPWVVAVLARCAARARARGAPGIAAEHLRRALAEPPAPEERAVLLASLAEAEAAAGLPGALAHLEQALGLIADRHERAELLGRLGRLLWAHGRHEEAASTFGRGLAEVDNPAAPLARELKARHALAAHQAGAPLDSLEGLLAELRRTAPRAELQPGERAVLGLLAAALAVRGAPCTDYRSLVARAVEGTALIDEMPYDNGMMLIVSAVALLHADELDLALRTLDAALQRARRNGSVLAQATVSYLRAWPAYFSGAVVDAAADAELALAARRHGWSMQAAPACAVLAHARIERGDLPGAAAALAEAETLGLPDQAADHTLLLVARGRLRLLQHDAAGALGDLQESGRRDDVLGIRVRPVAWRGLAVEAALALGDRSTAATLAAAERERAERIGAARTVGVALRVSGLVEGGGAGVDLLRDSCAILARSPSRLEHARALVDLGAGLRRLGERAASRDPLRQGLDMAERFGALPLAERARQELLVAGARPRRTALRGVDALTASERRVANLAAGGLTNREIAQALFVTPKAVEFHMQHVLQKLDIASRADLRGALPAVAAD